MPLKNTPHPKMVGNVVCIYAASSHSNTNIFQETLAVTFVGFLLWYRLDHAAMTFAFKLQDDPDARIFNFEKTLVDIEVVE